MLSTKGKTIAHETMVEPTQNAFLLANKPYQMHSAESIAKSLKKLAGEVAGLLFYLQNPLSQHQRQKTWHIFESKLQEYLDLKVREVAL